MIPTRYLAACVLSFLVLASTASLVAAQETPSFRLGFKALADQIPDVAGKPLENEHYSPNGDSIQRTTTGLMVWRKADNWTAFTDGSRTWINGPYGIQSRSNDERFPWEGDYARRFTLAEQDVPSGLVLDPTRSGSLPNELAANRYGNPDETLRLFEATGRTGGYRAYYSKEGAAVLAGPAIVDSSASIYQSSEGAHLSFVALKAGSEMANWNPVPMPQVADESAALTSTVAESFAGERLDWVTFLVTFRKGTVLGSLTVTGRAGTVGIEDALRLVEAMAAKA